MLDNWRNFEHPDIKTGAIFENPDIKAGAIFGNLRRALKKSSYKKIFRSSIKMNYDMLFLLNLAKFSPNVQNSALSFIILLSFE